jgi:hypothetical protein
VSLIDNTNPLVKENEIVEFVPELPKPLLFRTRVQGKDKKPHYWHDEARWAQCSEILDQIEGVVPHDIELRSKWLVSIVVKTEKTVVEIRKVVKLESHSLHQSAEKNLGCHWVC